MIVELFNPQNYHATLYALPIFVVGVMSLAVGIRVLIRDHSSKISIVFFALIANTAFWLLAYGMVVLSIVPATAFHWARIENMAVVWIPSTVFLFAAAAAEKFRRLLRWILGSFLLSALFFFTVLATPWFVTQLRHYPWGYYAAYGPITYAFLAFFFVLMFVSLRLYWIEYKHLKGGVKKKRFQIFLFGFCTGYLASVDYLPTYGIPVYPFGYLPFFIFLLTMAWGIRRYRLLEITPSFAADQIIRTMSDGVMVIDYDGRLRVANEAAYQLFGPALRNLGVNTISQLGIPFFKRENLARLIWEGTSQTREILYQDPEKGTRNLEVSSSVIRDRENHPTAIVCIVKDITIRKIADQAMRDSEKRYRLLAENVTDVIWTADMNLKLTYISPSVRNLRGYDVEEAMQQSLLEMLTPDSQKLLTLAITEELAVEHTMPDGEKFRSRTLELEYLSKEGYTIWTEVKLTFLRNEAGIPVEILGVTRDITARRRAEEALRETERRYSDLIREAPDPIITLDRLGYLQFLNPAAETATGYNSSELVGKHFAKSGVLAPESVARTLQEFTLVILGWQRSPFEVKVVRRDGIHLTFEANPRLIRREKENMSVQVIFRDITDRPRSSSKEEHKAA